MDLAPISEALDGHRQTDDSYRMRCPAHSGANANLVLKLDGDKVLAKCWSAACTFAEIAQAIVDQTGLSIWIQKPDHRPQRNPIRKPEFLVASYRHARTGSLKHVYRLDHFVDEPCIALDINRRDLPCSDCESGEGCETKWRPPCPRRDVHKHVVSSGSADGYELLLFIPERSGIDERSPIVIVEGEKAATAVRDAGHIGASYPHGHGGVEHTVYAAVNGRDVVLWPDDDDAGRSPLNALIERCYAAGANFVALVKTNTQTGDDAADRSAVEIDMTIRLAVADSKVDDPRAILQYPEISDANATPHHNAVRFLLDHAQNLVVAMPSNNVASISETPANAKINASVFFSDENGKLVGTYDEIAALLARTAKKYASKAFQASRDGAIAQRDAKHLLSTPGYFAVRDRIGPVIALTRQEATKIPNLEIREEHEIDAEMRFLGAPNGVVDLQTGRILDRDEARKTFVSASLPDPFDADATHPLVDGLENSEDASYQWLWSYLGWALSHLPQRDLVAMVTQTGSGKSSFHNWMTYSFGPSYVLQIRSATLQSGQQGPTSHNSGLFKFERPARFVFCPDAEGRFQTRLVNLVTGGDILPARRAYGNELPIDVTGHLIIQGNRAEVGEQFLQLHGDSETIQALQERLRMIPLAKPRRPDPALKYIARSDQNFRKAFVAMIVRKAVEMFDRPEPPPATDGMISEKRRQTADDAPSWHEWLDGALIDINISEAHQHPGRSALGNTHQIDGGANASCTESHSADSQSIADAFKAWWEETHGGTPPRGASSLRVQNALVKLYSIPPDAKFRRYRTVNGKPRYYTAYDGYALRCPICARDCSQCQSS